MTSGLRARLLGGLEVMDLLAMAGHALHVAHRRRASVEVDGVAGSRVVDESLTLALSTAGCWVTYALHVLNQVLSMDSASCAVCSSGNTAVVSIAASSPSGDSFEE